jgi:Fur family ferric uptake transcriptional regulator
MYHQFNYEELLSGANIEATPNRVSVLEAVGNNSFPLFAGDIYEIMKRISSINRVTVYRILDLLVEHGVVERISTGGIAFYNGLAPNDDHRQYLHFYCKDCGQMDCLSPALKQL